MMTLSTKATVKDRIRSRLREAVMPKHWPSNLAVMRWIIGLFALDSMLSLRRALAGVSQRVELHHFAPVGPVRLLSEPLAESTSAMVMTATIVAGGFFAVGLAYRLTGPLFGVLALWVLAYRNSWGFVYHTQQLMALHLLILGFAPSADRFSVDAWLRKQAWYPGWARFVAGSAIVAKQGPSFRYGWPVQLAIVVTGLAYWIAGIAKLRYGGGLEWVTEGVLAQHVGDNALRYILYRDQTREVTFQLFQLGGAVPVMLGGASMLLELTAPLAILHRRFAYLVAASLFGFHLGVYWLMGIRFPYQMSGVCFAVFLRWDLMLKIASQWWQRRRPNLLRGRLGAVKGEVGTQ